MTGRCPERAGPSGGPARGPRGLHRLERACEECLYSALEEGCVGVLLRERGRIRSLRVRLEPFTLVGATTRLGALSEPLRRKWSLPPRSRPRAAERRGVAVRPEAAREVVRRSRGTPREALRILARARGVAQVSSAAGALSHVGQPGRQRALDPRRAGLRAGAGPALAGELREVPSILAWARGPVPLPPVCDSPL